MPLRHEAMTDEDIPAFQAALLAWFVANGRDLPFRRTRDPYAVWVSEVMLQQTTVAAGTPFWERFMRRYPTVKALADAPLEEVLHAWSGLGYYARARNLHHAARAVMERYGGVFPARYDDLMALPGVGPYTAGAVASLAGGEDAPVVDTNVARILARVFASEGDLRSAPMQRALGAAAGRILPGGRAREWTLALFDLGSAVCVSADPRCPVCPVKSFCAARREGRQNDLPRVAPRASTIRRTDVAAVIRDGTGRLLMLRRPEVGVWPGMWELPRGTLEAAEDPRCGLRRILRGLLGAEIEPRDELATLRHTVMRHTITLRAFEARLARPLDGGPEPPRRWVGRQEWAALPLASPQKRLLERLRAREVGG